MPHGRLRLEVYTLVDPSEVVDSVLELVEDHSPKPMVDMKPVEKNPTAADKFDKHQSEYESRAKSRDRVKQAEEHNSAYPQLKDELDRRRSCTRIQSDNREQNAKTTNRSRRMRSPRRKERKTKRRENRTRVTKNRRRHTTRLRRAMKYSRIQPYVCDYCGCHYVTKDVLPRRASHPVSRVPSSVERFKSHHTRDSMSNISHKYPEPSEATVSSYHSFYSSDHEPME